MFWSMHSGIIAAIAVVCARYVAVLVPLGDRGVRATAAAAILILTGVNYVGVRQGALLQTGLTVLKIAAIVVLLALLVTGARVHPVLLAGGASAAGFAAAVGAGLFAFGGWHMVTYAAGETADPERTIPRALLIGTAAVVLIYLALNAAYLFVLPIEKVFASTRLAADAVAAAAGERAAAGVSVLVVASSFGALSGIILAGPRVYLAMAEDGLLFKWFARVHPRFHTPAPAIVAQGAWSAALAYTGTYRALFSRVVFTEWIFFAALALGAMRMRRVPGYAPRFRAWGFPVTPALFAAASIAVVAGQLAADPGNSAIGLALVASGAPVFYLWRSVHARHRLS
jgi:APA family basic amino acid/polyamine antiporter